MKICILATGRCGSTSLFGCIKDHLHDGYAYLTEPFDRYKKNKENIRIDTNTSDVLLKTLVGQIPNEKDGMMVYKWIFETFDKVIILDRKNKIEQTESFAFHTSNKIRDRHNVKRVYYLNGRTTFPMIIGAIAVFVYARDIVDKVLFAPADNSFITYKWLCDLSHSLRLGDAICLAGVDAKFQSNTMTGQFVSTFTIAFVGSFIVAFPSADFAWLITLVFEDGARVVAVFCWVFKFGAFA